MGLGQKVELFGGENEPKLGKQYRKLEKDLCGANGAGMGGTQSLQTDPRMKSVHCGALLGYCMGD